jgi:hypothetical protein
MAFLEVPLCEEHIRRLESLKENAELEEQWQRIVLVECRRMVFPEKGAAVLTAL